MTKAESGAVRMGETTISETQLIIAQQQGWIFYISIADIL